MTPATTTAATTITTAITTHATINSTIDPSASASASTNRLGRLPSRNATSSSPSSFPVVRTGELRPMLATQAIPGSQPPSGTYGESSGSVIQRRKTEKAGSQHKQRKRAIDSKDGPGSGPEQPLKAPRPSTPPGSPRSSMTGGGAGKQLVRSPRAVTNLRKAATLSQRPSDRPAPHSTASLLKDDRQHGPQPSGDSSDRQPATSAPAWIPVSHGKHNAAVYGSVTLSPRRASAVTTTNSSEDARDDKPGVAPEFACSAPAPSPLPHVQAPQGATSEWEIDATLITRMLIETEFENARDELARALKAYQPGSENNMAMSASSAVTSTMNHAFEDASRALNQCLAKLFEMIRNSDLCALKDAVEKISMAVPRCLSALPDAGSTPELALEPVRLAMNMLETACKSALDTVADEMLRTSKEQTPTSCGSIASSSTTKSSLPLTTSTVSLMDELDSLLDVEIVANRPAIQEPKLDAKQ